jgi:hypothetical protein
MEGFLMKNKHTPTPWKAVQCIEDGWEDHLDIQQDVSDDDDKNDYVLVNSLGFDEVATNKEDIKHIVKCVNMHDELVEAIEKALDMSDEHLDETGTFNSHMRKTLEDVLQKAKGE